MTKNIKEIGKELLGKSLNSYHRRTGLTQLEKNNEMQDGILDGILSQVDDAYIEKTEQSNVIHLDGSGDGVVVVDSIEGNTMVNIWDINKPTVHGDYGTKYVKPNTIYTIIGVGISGENAGQVNVRRFRSSGGYGDYAIKVYSKNENSIFKGTITTNSDDIGIGIYSPANLMSVKDIMILEGDWTNKPMSTYFEGLQSSFEEKVDDEGKYEIEILSNNSNLLSTIEVKQNHTYNEINPFSVYVSEDNQCSSKPIYIKHLQNKYIHIQRILGIVENTHHASLSFYDEFYNKIKTIYDNAVEVKQLVPSNAWYCAFRCKSDNKVLYLGEYRNYYIEPKQNKIKLLINSPLLKGDKLVVKDGKLCHYHKMGKDILNGNESWSKGVTSEKYLDIRLNDMSTLKPSSHTEIGGICDVLPYRSNKNGSWIGTNEGVTRYPATNGIILSILKTRLSTQDVQGFKQWLQYNPVTVVYELEEPYYEEVLNEYGEPIILEGYENGTLYIDSTVIPTTTVRYTPKMESFKTLKEVNKNNNLITLDINENIIPYMMDVDYMIMEKELCLLNTKSIRKMEELDMTSMQKRTGEMLERLIKGKSLNEQECKTRVTVYLNTGKITDEQAKELNFLIDEIYA